jgi:imidazole glycerol-phosphate synthase subunit HisH
MITIVDYGLGNITAFLNVYKRLNLEARTASTPAELAGATRLILPGVGHFDHAMDRLEASGMRTALDELVLGAKVPVVGVCVGMQMLADSSDEGTRPGLGWIPGRVRSFSAWEPAAALPLPHMGWNDVAPRSTSPLFAGLESDARFYFLHSFFFECAQPGHVLAEARYGAEFGCAVNAGNIYGVQFHPEKSHHYGTRLLQNFAEL